jgi:hypothetical protein
MTGYAVEITEFAIGDTDVGGIDVTVDLPGYLSMRHLFATQFIGQEHQISQRGFFIKLHPFFYRQKSEIKRFVIQVGKIHSAANLQRNGCQNG